MSYVSLERVGEHVALITMDRPERYNALSFALLRDFHATLDELERDLTYRVAVITGAGKGFCAGLDLKAQMNGEDGEWEPGLGRMQNSLRMQEAFGNLVIRMRRAPQPLIAAVNGPAAGGGFAIALACDVRLCAPPAKFNCAFIRLGLGAADMGVSFFLPKVVGSAYAAELMYTGRFVEAEEARDIGIVSRIVDGEALLDTALTLANEMVANAAPLGLRLTKQALDLAQGGLSLEQAVHIENRNQVLALQTEDFRAGITHWQDRANLTFADQ